jgi:hypothetical protein
MIEHSLSSSTMINHDVASYFLPQRKHGKKREKTCSTRGTSECRIHVEKLMT